MNGYMKVSTGDGHERSGESFLYTSSQSANQPTNTCVLKVKIVRMNLEK